MTVEKIRIDNSIKSIENMSERLDDLKTRIECRLSLNESLPGAVHIDLTQSVLMRICLLVGLSDKSARSRSEIDNIHLPLSSTPYPTTFFTKDNIGDLFTTLLRLRYHEVEADWSSTSVVSRVIGHEMLRGHNMLMQEGALDQWLRFRPRPGGGNNSDIPLLNIVIGTYGSGDQVATLDLNSTSVSNNQIVVAGTTGSGKSNLLTVLLQQIRANTADSHFPVGFLLFDYKGEFSDPKNAAWLKLFETNSAAIYNPMKHPLPFNPFRDLSGCSVNEINTYSTTLASGLAAIASTKISSVMENRLSNAIIAAYKQNNQMPVNFERVLSHYTRLAQEDGKNGMDSIQSVLDQLVKNKLFNNTDSITLEKDCCIINLGQFPKDGPLAKAIVFFSIEKLNNIYASLPAQEKNDQCVQIRHFTVIDEAHYMLSFDNQPLRNLIAVGRNKGMSIILATQNMADYKSPHFDFLSNVQYPLIMKQQQIDDKVLGDLFGVSRTQLPALKQDITHLQKGELIVKDPTIALLGLGNPWKKIKVTHLI